MSLKRNINTTISIITKLKISVTMEYLKRFTDLPQLIRACSHNHGEDLKLLIQSMDLKIHHSNGLIKNHLPRRNTNTITSIIIKLKILVITVSLRKFMDLPLLIKVFYHNHGEELRNHTQSMDSKIHHSSGLIRSL